MNPLVGRPPLPVRNPHSGVEDFAITPLDARQVEAAAAALRARQPAWAALPVEARCAALLALADALERHAAPITDALTADTGRAAVAGVELRGVVAGLRRWAARAPVILAAATRDAEPAAMPGVTWGTRPVPYELAGVISPWNFPLLLALTDAVPALAAGCAVLVKPSEVTPRFIAPLMAAVAETPLDGLLRLIEGDGETGAALPDVCDFIAFTGSVATGRKVAEACARAFVPCSLELGGKDPLIVLASTDPAHAARVALSASCRGTGQACQSIERIYVARPIADAFTAALVEAADAVPLNTAGPDAPGLGPFIFARQAAQVQAQIDEAVVRGARVLAGGQVEDHGGLWLRPTVITNVSPDMALMREETFGPVMPVTVFDTVDEAVALANAGDFGLSAAVLAGTLAEAAAVGEQLHAGAVSLNDAALTALLSDAEKHSFGLSGLGPPRSGPQGLLRFTRTRAFYAQAGQPLPLQAFL